MAVRLQLEGIRCFSAAQEGEIRPITLLVGENSSGKSTFLAAYRLACAIANNLKLEPFFNEPPFPLGAYDQIASFRNGRTGRARRFSIGLCRGEDCDESLRAEFGPEKGQPSIHAWRLATGELAIQFADEGAANCGILLENQTRKIEDSAEGLSAEELIAGWIDLSLEDFMSLGKPQKQTIFSPADFESLKKSRRSMQKEFPRQPFAFAPIRTEPRRTYDPVGVRPEPEGSHVPMLLAQLARSANKALWNDLRSALRDYGSASGLFGDVEVVQKGKKESDPANTQITNWLLGSRADPRLVATGLLRVELGRLDSVRRLLVALDRAGRLRRVDSQVLEREQARLHARRCCRSNDVHVLALAIVSGARTLATRDNPLASDFKDPAIIRGPRGRIYRDPRKHGRLLGHTPESCGIDPRHR